MSAGTPATLLGPTASAHLCSGSGVHGFHLSVLRQKENYLNGSFLFYVEKNQNLKDNFGNHTRTTDFYSAVKRNKLLIMYKPVDDSQKH